MFPIGSPSPLAVSGVSGVGTAAVSSFLTPSVGLMVAFGVSVRAVLVCFLFEGNVGPIIEVLLYIESRFAYFYGDGFCDV